MSQSNPTITRNQTNCRHPRKCSVCHETGHDRRNCPSRDINAGTTTPAASQRRTAQGLITASINFESCVYCVFDLETTGFSRNYHDIIEICAILVDSSGKVPEMDVATFHSYVKPSTPINQVITGITGISDDTVATAPSFQECGRDFIKFLQDNCKRRSTIGDFGEFGGDDDDSSDDSDNDAPFLRDIVLVAHNGNRFDIPFLFHSLQTHGVDISGIPFKGKIDTIDLAKYTIREDATTMTNIPPANYKLTTLYQHVTGLELDQQHTATADAKATLSILQSESYWANRKKVCKAITNIPAVAANNTPTSQRGFEEDSDTDAESDLDESGGDDEGEEVEDEFIEDDTMGSRWRLNAPFTAPDVRRRYNDMFTSETRSGRRTQPGLKLSKNTVNSPIKAWNFIFTEPLLKKIVRYTNEYGQEKCSRWADITTNDLREFFAILFIAGIHKRKDATTNWWSDDQLLEFPVVKRIMSGRKFHSILRYLHVCDMRTQPSVSSPTYTPMYKVQELMDYLAQRYSLAFEAGHELSLDESLIRAFGRIKFKVRIITKAARYGIKVYVLADAKTSYVLNVLVYTGQYTYYNSVAMRDMGEEMKKTVKVCKELCESYKGSHRVIYVDRFYTSLELIKELESMDLYVTGTVMSNRVPVRLRIAKNSREFKDMERGDHKVHVYEYKKNNGKDSQCGLICWKDKDIVYCLTNATDTLPSGHCFRCSNTGRICMNRPLAIQQYNTNMGGVDLADQRRLHCNSTIKGLHRWWLKLFFYQLDVGTSNALVLYNEAMGTSMNITNFKKELVKGWVGHKLRNIVPEEPTLEHSLVRGEGRLKCVYCDLLSDKNRRTRYYCSNPDCMLPLCNIDPDKDIRDCFALAHSNEQIRCALVQRRDRMKQKANRKRK